jgi:hypothetical protein
MLPQSLGLKCVGQSQSHVTTDGQPVSQSWCRAPSGAHDQILRTCVGQGMGIGYIGSLERNVVQNPN